MKKAVQFIISEAGRASLATAGITTGWITAWLHAAGAAKVEILSLEAEMWKSKPFSWQVFYADEQELIRTALAHNARLTIREDNRRSVAGAEEIKFENPERTAWVYEVESGRSVMLLPLGDIAYQRESWLAYIRGNESASPVKVYIGDDGLRLEPGLSASIDPLFEPSGSVLNEEAWLPEEQVLLLLRRYNLKLRFAESCTAGGISARIARIPGASEVLDRSWVVYSNDAKKQLKVPTRLIEKRGAVSREVVELMAISGSDDSAVCLAVSGIAGPGGGTAEKPVGTVWMAVSGAKYPTRSQQFLFHGSRSEIQSQSVVAALALFIEFIRT